VTGAVLPCSHNQKKKKSTRKAECAHGNITGHLCLLFFCSAAAADVVVSIGSLLVTFQPTGNNPAIAASTPLTLHFVYTTIGGLTLHLTTCTTDLLQRVHTTHVWISPLFFPRSFEFSGS
jgi:hypothetical protein